MDPHLPSQSLPRLGGWDQSVVSHEGGGGSDVMRVGLLSTGLSFVQHVVPSRAEEAPGDAPSGGWHHEQEGPRDAERGGGDNTGENPVSSWKRQNDELVRERRRREGGEKRVVVESI